MGKWNDFHSNATKAFSLFRSDDYLHDVTLVSDDHKQISAHKLVLSACSDYFDDIFKNSKHSHLMLCLDGVNNQDLNNILDYIYNGEVQLNQDDLDRFLLVAKRFQLNGLIGNDQIKEEEHKDEGNFDLNFKPTFSNLPRKPALLDNLLNPEATTFSINVDDVNNVKEKINEYLKKCSDGSYMCKICGKTGNNRNAPQNLRNHIQTHLEGLSFSCNLCQKNLKSLRNLEQHKYSFHKP